MKAVVPDRGWIVARLEAPGGAGIRTSSGGNLIPTFFRHHCRKIACGQPGGCGKPVPYRRPEIPWQAVRDPDFPIP